VWCRLPSISGQANHIHASSRDYQVNGVGKRNSPQAVG
jgi:hypothetical protein